MVLLICHQIVASDGCQSNVASICSLGNFTELDTTHRGLSVIGLPQQKLATSFFSVNLLYDDKFSLSVSPISGGASDNGTVLYYLIVKGRNHIYYCILQPMYQNPFQRYYCIFKGNPKPFKAIAYSHMLYILKKLL